MAANGLRVCDEGVAYTLALSADPLSIGRAPGNGVCLTDPSISWHHATVWVGADRVWIRDLGSTNGVFVDGNRIRGEAVFPAGVTVRLGNQVTLSLVVSPDLAAPARIVEDRASGLRQPLTVGRTPLAALGLGAEGDLELTASGEVWLWVGDARRTVALGAWVDGGAGPFRVLQPEHPATLHQHDEPYPYRLTVRLSEPAAEIVDRATQNHVRITSENRVVLLYLLGRQIQADLQAGRPTQEVGWCDDDDLSLGIWGKGERAMSTLPVTVHRLRKELAQAGFDHQFLEKGRRSLRARLVDVAVVTGDGLSGRGDNTA